MKKRAIAAAIAASTMAVATSVGAAWTFSATNGSNLSATAIFDIVGGNLQVVLSNVGGDVLVPADVLTALFFDIPNVAALTPISAVLTSGSTAVFDAQGQPAGGVVGGEWDYISGVNAPGSATEGIGSAGFGLFADGGFPGADLDPPAAVNGMNYGLLSASDNLATGNAQVTGNNPFVRNSVTFTLSGIPANFDLTTIGEVSFQYGTALTEPNIPGSGGASTGGASTGGASTGGQIPEPSSTSLALLGVALLGAGMWKRRLSTQG